MVERTAVSIRRWHIVFQDAPDVRKDPRLIKYISHFFPAVMDFRMGEIWVSIRRHGAPTPDFRRQQAPYTISGLLPDTCKFF
jgi:hypothetical protein